jgi:hypothetical protein
MVVVIIYWIVVDYAHVANLKLSLNQTRLSHSLSKGSKDSDDNRQRLQGMAYQVLLEGEYSYKKQFTL